MSYLKVAILLAIVATALAQNCASPKFSNVKTVTTTDTKLNTETAFVVQFKAQCSNNAKNVPFFAVINGQIITSSADESGQVYQLSWTESHKKATSGETKLRVFDEEGFSALKKAQRNNEDLGKVKEIQTFSIYHPGSSQVSFVQSELLAVVLFGAIFYWAHTNKAAILA